LSSALKRTPDNMNDASSASSSPPTCRVRALVALAFVLAAFIHANLWGQIIPLWQIPDEAAHFEYVHLLTRLGRRPTPADADPALQAAMLRSMWENNYWEYLGYRRPEQPPTRILPGGWTSGGPIPDTAVVGDAFVGAFSQLQNPTPVYYALLAPIQALVMDQPIDAQLRVLRLASRVIFALGVMFIVLTAGELFAWRWPAVIAAGLFGTLQPMFTYIGSGLNNDNGVMFFTALLTWQLARGWRRGYPWPRLLLILALTILAIYAKRTAVFLVLWVPIVLGAWALSRMARLRVQRVVLAGVGGLAALSLVAAVLYFIDGPTPANWRSASPWRATWTADDAAEGWRAFALRERESTLTTSFKRPFGLADSGLVVVEAQAKGGPGTLSVRDDNGNTVEARFAGAADWQPISVTLPLAPSASRMWIALSNADRSTFYVDGLRAYAHIGEQAIPLPIPNPSAEDALPLLGQLVLEVAQPLGIYGQAVRLVREYRENLAALPARLPEAIAFVQQSYWGKFGIFARAATPTLHLGWVTLLALLVGATLGQAVRLVVSRQPDRDTAALLGLWLVGGGLLIIQTFAPLLSFAAEGLWLPQGRYLFGGMGLIAPVMASHALAVQVDRYGLVMLIACIWLVLALSLYNTAFGYYSAIAP
jgi:hypothetical protein